jgi:hypothetical protein
VAFAHEGLPRPGRDLECQHFVLDCDAPLLLVMVDGVSRASSCMLAVSGESRKLLREVLSGHEAVLRDDRLWLLRLGEVTSGLPQEFAKRHPEAASSLSHHVLVLLGDRDAHFVGVRDALRRVLGKYE